MTTIATITAAQQQIVRRPQPIELDAATIRRLRDQRQHKRTAIDPRAVSTAEQAIIPEERPCSPE